MKLQYTDFKSLDDMQHFIDEMREIKGLNPKQMIVNVETRFGQFYNSGVNMMYYRLWYWFYE